MDNYLVIGGLVNSKRQLVLCQTPIRRVHCSLDRFVDYLRPSGLILIYLLDKRKQRKQSHTENVLVLTKGAQLCWRYTLSKYATYANISLPMLISNCVDRTCLQSVGSLYVAV